MVMRVRRQAAVDELDAPAIEELAAWRDSDKHRRATVLGHAEVAGRRVRPLATSYGCSTIRKRARALASKWPCRTCRER